MSDSISPVSLGNETHHRGAYQSTSAVALAPALDSAA